MWTDEQLEQLEATEREISLEEVALMILLLTTCHEEFQKEINNFYTKYGKDGVVTYNEARKWVSDKNRKKRYLVLFATLGTIITTHITSIEDNFNFMQAKILKKVSDFFSVKVDEESLILRAWGNDDLNWKDRLWNNRNKWLFYIQKDIKQSIMRGDNVNDVLIDLEKRFTSIEKALKWLALNESTAMDSMARQEIFKDLGVTKYRFYTREDERTCEECNSLHGLTFPMSAYEVGVTASPIHNHCRCWEVPIME